MTKTINSKLTITRLTYKTNQNLLAEMTRIWPEFEPESEYIFYSQSEHKNGSYIKFLTPGDLIRFLQAMPIQLGSLLLNFKFIKKIINELLFDYDIFFSTKNFEAGAIWLTEKLEQIK